MIPLEFENVTNVNRCPPIPVIVGNVPPPRAALRDADDTKSATPETSITPHPSIVIVPDTVKSPFIVTGHMMGDEVVEMDKSDGTTQFPLVH